MYSLGGTVWLMLIVKIALFLNKSILFGMR